MRDAILLLLGYLSLTIVIGAGTLGYAETTGDFIDQFIAEAQEGDILWVNHPGFLPGGDHVGIITGHDEVTEAYNSSDPRFNYDHDGDGKHDGGVGHTSIRRFITRYMSYDWWDIALLRVKANPAQRRYATIFAKMIEANKTIDYNLFMVLPKFPYNPIGPKVWDTSYYCSHLIWAAYKAILQLSNGTEEEIDLDPDKGPIKPSEIKNSNLTYTIISKRGSGPPEAIEKGLDWLKDHQNLNGSWDGPWGEDVGVTSLATLAFLNQGYSETFSPNDVVRKAVQYILQNVKSDGSIHNGAKTYHTSLAILALVATHNFSYYDEIANAKDYLLNIQNVERNTTINDTNPIYGGWGYGESDLGIWSDLSNTQFALMALDAAYRALGLDKSDYRESETWTNAAFKFLQRVQNRRASNDQPWASNDGGFTYHPTGWGPGGIGSKSYGSMTAAGIWSLRLIGVPFSSWVSGDPRIQLALNWLWRYENLDFDDNPNAYDGRAYQYYYYFSVSKALAITVNDFPPRNDWFRNLSAELVSLQNVDGYWVNDPDVGHGAEYSPELATSFALLALQTRKPPVVNLWMAIILASNADLHVYDPQGRHLGKNYKTGQIEDEIPGASFEVDAEGRQIITLPKLAAGIYRLELVGTGTGPYSLTVKGYRDEEEISSQTIEGTIKQGEDQAGTVTVTSIVGELTLYVEAPQTIPSGLVATPRDTAVDLSWNPYNAEFDLAGYNVYRSTTSHIDYTKINTALVTETTYHDSGLTNGITYYYVITAIDTEGNETDYSREASATPTTEGDINEDGAVDATDVRWLVEAIMRLRELTPEQRARGDVAPPPGLDATDTRYIVEFIQGIRSTLTASGTSAEAQATSSTQVQRAQVEIESKQNIISGETTTLQLSISGLSGPGLADLQIGPQGVIKFDPKVIQVKSIKGLGQFQVMQPVLIDNEKGEVRFIAVVVGKKFVKEGPIIELEVRAIGREGESSLIEITGLDVLRDGEIHDIKATIVNGQVTLGKAQKLQVSSVLNIPNPVTGRSVEFRVEGVGIKTAQVEIYDLSGQRVFSSGEVFGNTLEWNLQNDSGNIVANGVYLYLVTVRGFNGEVYRSSVKKLVVLR